MKHKCPVCGCTRYVESGQVQGGYEMTLSDDPDELREIEEASINADIHNGILYRVNKYVKCAECGKRYKPTI